MKITTLNGPKGMYFQPEEIHDHCEILLRKEGSGILTIEGQETVVSAGSIAYIPAGVRHSDQALEPSRNGHLTFAPVSSLPSSFRLLHDEDHRFEQVFDLAADAMLQAGSSSHSLQSGSTSPEGRNHLAFAYSLGDTLFLLLQNWCDTLQPEANSAVETIDRQIRLRFAEPDFDLTAEIARTGYSVGYFRSIFRDQIGRPPQAQLNHIRVEYAKSQMQIYQDAVPIKIISANAGFLDPYYFSRLFKQMVGVSPKEYLASLH